MKIKNEDKKPRENALIQTADEAHVCDHDQRELIEHYALEEVPEEDRESNALLDEVEDHDEIDDPCVDCGKQAHNRGPYGRLCNRCLSYYVPA